MAMTIPSSVRQSAIALALCASLFCAPAEAARDAAIGVTNAAGILVVKVGEMRFYAAHTGLSECTHGAVLDEAALWQVGTPQAAMIILRERWHTPRGRHRVERWGATATQYLFESRGVALGSVGIQRDYALSPSADLGLESTVEVYAVLRGLGPYRTIYVDDYFARGFPLTK
jgi:hypothetical protein